MEVSMRRPMSSNTQRAGKRSSRFTLRSLLLLVAGVGVWLSWLNSIAVDQRAVFQIVSDCGGTVYFRHQEDDAAATPPLRTWLASQIGDEFVFSISGVYLEGTNVDDTTAEQLASRLERLRYLKWLEFRGTKISDTGVQHLTGVKSLERLFIRPLRDPGPIYKPPNPIGITDAALESIAKLKNLKCLSISHGKVSGEGFQHLSRLSRMEELYLQSTDIQDDDLAHLKGLKQLREIMLWKSDVSDAGLTHLSHLPNLENVYLVKSKITDDGLRMLTTNHKLQIIDVSSTKITDKGLIGFEKLQSLVELRLFDTQISDDGLPPLKSLKSLRDLDLGQTSITDVGLKQMESWKHLRNLKVSAANKVSPAAVLRLRNALPKCLVY